MLGELVGQRSGVPFSRLPDVLVGEESRNVHYWRGAARTTPERIAALSGVATPDGNPVLRYHYHKSVGGLEYLFAFTRAHAYLWSEGTASYALMFTCTSNCSRWSTADSGQYVVATNNLDLVQYWDDATPAVGFAPLGGASGICYDTVHYLTRAEYVIAHYRYLHLLSTVEDGTEWRNLDRWCSAGDITDWDETHSSGGDANTNVLGDNDHITGAGIYDVQGANQVIIFTENSQYASWLVTDDVVYECHSIQSLIGCVSDDSIIQGPDGQLYYMSTDSDGLKQIRRVYDPNPLSADIQSTLDLMHPSYCNRVCGAYVGQFGELWWSIPSTGASTANDLTIVLNLQTMTWQPNIEFGVSAFGYYTQQTAVRIDDMTEIIDTLSGPIDSYAPAAGKPTFLMGDDSGLSRTISASSRTQGGTLVMALNGRPEEVNRFKRYHGAWLIFVSRPGTLDTVTCSIRAGDQAAYVNKGTVNLAVAGQEVRGYLRFDSRLRNGHVKLTASNPFDFLGVIMDYGLCGERS
jgi:hypothetical protein